MRFSVYIFSPSVLTLSNLKLYKHLAVKDTSIQEKFQPRLIFNPGLALIGFRTTGPWTAVYPFSSVSPFCNHVVEDKLKGRLQAV